MRIATAYNMVLAKAGSQLQVEHNIKLCPPSPILPRCMPFRNHIQYIVILSFFFICCNEITLSEPTEEIESEKVKFLLYDSAFAFDSTSKIKVSGYYRVREVFGVSFKPSYGFLQFFPDGFCKVGHWNGIFTSAAELDKAFDDNPPYVFWGVYKTVRDTLLIEYLYSPATPGRNRIERRYTLAGLIKENEIVITSTDSRKYSYPENLRDSLISSCIGKFVSHPSIDLPANNYLKKNMHKYQ